MRQDLELLQRKLSLEPRRPHILLFVADDLGWAGLGAHRSARTSEEAQGKAETQTPTFDALIKEGILLERHYASSSSGPSRCSLLSGRLPSHFAPKPEGLSTTHMFWNQADNVSGFYGIPRNMTGIASKLKEAGYSTHFVGKWDAGMATPEHTPFGRGFDTFLGTLESISDHWTQDHAQEDHLIDVCGNRFKDFSLYNATYRGGVSARLEEELGCKAVKENITFSKRGCTEGNAYCLPESCYKEAMLLEYALKLIRNHDSAAPLFLTYATQLVHPPIEIVKSTMMELNDRVAQAGVERKIPWTTGRKNIAASYLHMDTAMGKLVSALQERNMYDDTLIVFISDNGGGIFVGAAGNNYPLKGGKFADWEGGVRTSAFISGGFVPAASRGTSFQGVIHIVDWYATFCSLAGVAYFDHQASRANDVLRTQGLPLLAQVDGRPQMEHILSGSNARRDALHLSATAVLQWPFKLVTGRQEGSVWPGPVYPTCNLARPRAASVDIYGHKILQTTGANYTYQCMVEDCHDGCLFNVETDPSERSDLSSLAEYATVLAGLQEDLRMLNTQASHADLGQGRMMACVQAAKNGGFMGPFIDVDGFYTPLSISGLHSLDSKEYRQEPSAFHGSNSGNIIRKSVHVEGTCTYDRHHVCHGIRLC